MNSECRIHVQLSAQMDWLTPADSIETQLIRDQTNVVLQAAANELLSVVEELILRLANAKSQVY